MDCISEDFLLIPQTFGTIAGAVSYERDIPVGWLAAVGSASQYDDTAVDRQRYENERNLGGKETLATRTRKMVMKMLQNECRINERRGLRRRW